MRTDINYYAILRVDSNATEDQIRRAYRTKSPNANIIITNDDIAQTLE